MSGIEATKQILKNLTYTPIITFTANIIKSDREILSAEMDKCIINLRIKVNRIMFWGSFLDEIV